MTETAILGSGQMVDVLTHRNHAIVARRAVFHDARVIEHTGGKRSGSMTHGAIAAGGHVIHRFA